jgi:hypothetical protein
MNPHVICVACHITKIVNFDAKTLFILRYIVCACMCVCVCRRGTEHKIQFNAATMEVLKTNKKMYQVGDSVMHDTE